MENEIVMGRMVNAPNVWVGESGWLSTANLNKLSTSAKVRTSFKVLLYIDKQTVDVHEKV